MTDMQNVEELMSRDYEISLRKKGEGYIARIRDLNIYAKGESISDAIQNLEKKKLAFFEDLVENDAVDSIPEPGHSLNRTTGFASMSDAYSVIRNTILIVVIIAAGAWFAAPVISNRVIDQVSQKAVNSIFDGSKLRKGIRKILSTVAANVELLTPDVRDELLSDVQTIVTAVKPFIDEAKPLYCSPLVIRGNGG